LRKFGLIGFPLSHSFSKGYFEALFLQDNIVETTYENFPIASIDQFNNLWKVNFSLMGLNVTIPYKKEVIPYLQFPSTVVNEIQACNCIRKYEGALYGYNTDVIGFQKSLVPYLKSHHTQALILGTGGAAAAVEWVLKNVGISYKFVTRSSTALPTNQRIKYSDLTPSLLADHSLIINTSPVGMFPNITEAPAIPYQAITAKHHLFDLVYNPHETLFLKKGAAQGATIQNGLEMLQIQAAESWKIWNAPTPIIQ
jgi:shikimate dehydrogenase